MLGISLGEFLLIIAIAVFVISPKDMPEIAHYIIKFIARAKNFINNFRAEINNLSKEMGIDEIKNQVAIELASEIASQKDKIEKEITTIIDIYGKEHQVLDLGEIRKDKNNEEIMKEIAKYNLINQDLVGQNIKKNDQ